MSGFYTRFLQSVESYPASVAVELQRSDGTLESITYSELRARSESVGRWLRDSGMSEGIRCAILAGNGPLWVTAYLGVMSAGAVAVPLDTAFNHQQINKLLWDSGAAVIFTDSAHLREVQKAVDETLVRIVMIDGSGEGRYANLLGMLAAGPGNFTPAPVQDDSPAVIMYTSGTTADPKGVILTHGNLLAEAGAVFASIDVSASDSILGVLPLFHALAQMANLLLPFAAGARVVYLAETNTAELLRALGECGITLFCCVPQFFYLIHERVMKEVAARGGATRFLFRTLMAISSLLRKLHVNAGKVFFARIHRQLGPKMRYLVTGGSAFDPKIGRDFVSLGFNMLQAYGLTETTGGATVTPTKANVMGSVGQPLKGVEVKIMDAQPAEGAPLPVGEIAIAGGIVMKGYYNRPDATAEILRDGWLLTGDLGYLDARGNLFITGRKKEIIVLSSGKNIYPEEIEAHYLRSAFIKEICVMGLESRPGEPYSEKLHAVLVPNFEVLRERKIANSKEVIRFDIETLSAQLPATKRILSYEIWQHELPRTTTRKLKRFEIEQRVRREQESGQVEEEGQAAAEGRPLSEEDQLWLERPEAQRALRIVSEETRSGSGQIRPSDNLELDLGLDSIQRIELLMALQQEFGANLPESVMSEVYTVRELVDRVLAASGSGRTEAKAGVDWNSVLQSEAADEFVRAAIRRRPFTTAIGFVLAKIIEMISQDRFALQVTGLEKLPERGPCLICPNHQSFLDPIVLAGVVPWPLFRDAL